jgi:hypothetical protein
MAVQGAAPRIIAPATYWLAWVGEIHREKTWRKKSQEIKAMENGLTIEFTNGVTGTPLGFLAHRLNCGEIHFHQHGNDPQPDEYGGGQIDLAAGPEFESAEDANESGREFSEGKFR